jgi:type II secretory pathway pseudopilin PulG
MKRAPAGGTCCVWGFTVLETLVSLLLGLLLATVALATLAGQRRAQDAFATRADVLAAARTARHVLGAELRAQGAGAAMAVAGDSVSLRAFRGQALVCPDPGPADHIRVLSSGLNAPEAGEDSVLVFSSAPDPDVRLLVARAGAPDCQGSGEGGWEWWSISAPVPDGAFFLRFFTRGSYHLQGGALRYRSGSGGRQPLTPDVLDPRGGGIRVRNGALELDLAVPADSTRPWTFRFPLGGP